MVSSSEAFSALARSGSVTSQAKDLIREAVFSGAITSGEVYSVSEIATQFGCSRTPVREAVLQLEEAGLLLMHRNRGFSIRQANPRDLLEAFQVRLVLEPLVSGQVARRSDQHDLTVVTRAIQQLGELSEAGPSGEGNVSRFMAADHDFHTGILKALGNDFIFGTVSRAREVTFLRRMTVVHGADDARQVFEEHEEVYDAIIELDLARAEDAMRTHIRLTALRAFSSVGFTPPDGWETSLSA